MRSNMTRSDQDSISTTSSRVQAYGRIQSGLKTIDEHPTQNTPKTQEAQTRQSWNSLQSSSTSASIGGSSTNSPVNTGGSKHDAVLTPLIPSTVPSSSKNEIRGTNSEAEGHAHSGPQTSNNGSATALTGSSVSLPFDGGDNSPKKSKNSTLEHPVGDEIDNSSDAVAAAQATGVGKKPSRESLNEQREGEMPNPASNQNHDL